MPNCEEIVSITPPLPGWIRYRHIRTGRSIDFNPANPDHWEVMGYYQNNPLWANITAKYEDIYIDEDTKND